MTSRAATSETGTTAPSDSAARDRANPWAWGLRGLGVVLLLLAFAPLFRTLDTSTEAPHSRVSVEVAEATLQLAWWGTIVTVLAAWVLSRLLPTDRVRRTAARVAAQLERPPRWAWALLLAALSGGLAALVGIVLYRGYFTNVDEIASTVQARYIAHGMLAGPTYSVPEFWLIPNTLVVPSGWVSQFPPTHLAAMAAMGRLGVERLLGPLCLAVMVGLLALSLPRLLPDRPRVARVASLVVALCPFLIFMGGGSMSHVTAGALAAGVLYTSLRARDGHGLWSVATGGAIGLLVCDRPLVGLTLGAVFTVSLWGLPAVRRRASGPWLASRLGGLVLGGAPFAVLLAWYDARLFGSPLTLGYLAAFGDRHRLGFHMDPWGYGYHLREALGYTSSDVLSAGVQLLETPFPATALIGLALLVRRRLARGEGVLLAWAFVPVLANALYWFHDARMLFEAAPAWIALAVLAAVDLGGDASAQAVHGSVHRLRDAATWAVAIGIVGAVVQDVPARWSGYRWTDETLERITVPSPPTDAASIVFVHASWNERLSATLQGPGSMRQDTVISVLRRNTNCALQRYALAREARIRGGGDTPLPAIDLEQMPGTPSDIERPASPTGATVRVRRGEPFPETCLRQLRADRFGAVALAPLLWQGDLPGIETGRPLFVRDLGPERNQRLLEHYPKREAFVFTPTEAGAAPELLRYDRGMALLWGDS